MIDFINEDRFSSSEALRYLARLQDKKVFTFRQSDLIMIRSSNWIDNFDPRSRIFYEAKSEEELFKLLKSNGISFVLMPNYSWPTSYNTYFQSLLANPIYSTPLLQTINMNSRSDQYQLFKIEERKVSTSCETINFQKEILYAPDESIASRALYAFLGVPPNIQSGLTRFDPRASKNILDITRDQKGFLRSLNHTIDNYDRPEFPDATNRIRIRVELKSDSLISLKVRGIGRKSEDSNLLQFSRLINVGEDLDKQGNVEIVSQVLTSNDVGQLQLFLSATSGSDAFYGDVRLQVCRIDVLDDNSRTVAPFMKKIRIGVPKTVQADLTSCKSDSPCVTYLGKRTTNRLKFEGFEQALQRIYQGTSKLYTPFPSLSAKLNNYFAYEEGDLQRYRINCLKACPVSGTVYVSWTNAHGFLNRFWVFDITSPSSQVEEVYLPNLTKSGDVALEFSNLKGDNSEPTIYELRRVYAP